MELGKVVRGIWPRAQKGCKGERFWSNTRKDIKGMGRDDIREARDHSDAVPGIRYFKEGSVVGRRRRKSRGSLGL
jgi:hypothetical protein